MTTTVPKTIPNDQLSTVGDLQSWQVPIECAKCHDVIWSRWQGEFVTCKCGAISVDQTRHYSRWIGNKEDFIIKEKA